jgi:thiamine kinase
LDTSNGGNTYAWTAKLLLPETAIDSWRQWDGGFHTRPVILGPLSGGRSNRSFLLESDGKRLVLRLNSADSTLAGINRNIEIDIWKAASQQGIAPPLLFADENNRFLVSTYIDNSLPSQPPFDEAFTRHAFELLNRCHKLDVDAPAIDYISHVEHYWQIIENKGQLSNQALRDQRGPMQSMLESLIASNSPTGLCHHDPVVANFVGNTDRLYLIDWEYAARGVLVMDYATLGIEWGLDNKMVLAQTGLEPAMLTRAEAVYRYLCELWQEVTT